MESAVSRHDAIATGAIAPGTTYRNRINPCKAAGETTNVPVPSGDTAVTGTGGSPAPRRSTVRGRKTRTTRRRKQQARTGKTSRPKENWQHPPRGSFEAAGFLAREGYIVAKPVGPDPVFDLMGRSPDHEIIVKVVRPREPVRGAARVAERYLPEILLLRPYYRSPEDFVELWTYSREVGLARYRVYDWGIANAGTIEKLIKTQPVIVQKFPNTNDGAADRQTRNSPCPASVSG